MCYKDSEANGYSSYVRTINDTGIILLKSARNIREHLDERKTLNISKRKSEVTTLRKEKDILYSQTTDKKEVEQAESIGSRMEK